MSRQRPPCREVHGFTLVELLVVIGIIAVLISILLPVLNKAREQAKSIVCQSNMKQLSLAFVMYASAHNGATPIFPPIQGTYTPANRSIPGLRSLAYYMEANGLVRYDVGAFWPYLTTALHYTSTAPPGPKPTSPPPDVLYRVMNCPSDDGYHFTFKYRRNFSYSWNAQLWCVDASKTSLGFGPNLAIGDTHAVSKITQIKEPSHKVILCEEVDPNDGWCVIDLGANEVGSPADTPAFRHNGRSSWGFADGHVESLAPNDVGYSTVYRANVISVPINRGVISYYFHLQSNAK